MAEDDFNEVKLLVNMLEVRIEKLVFRCEACNLQLIDLRGRMESLEAWRRQTQEGSDLEVLQDEVLEMSNKLEEMLEGNAKKRDDSANGTAEFKFRVMENADKVEAEKPVQHLLTGTESLPQESKAEFLDNLLQQLERESRSLADFIEDAGKSEHLPMEEVEKIESVIAEEKDCTQFKVLEDPVDLTQRLSKGTKSEEAFKQRSEQSDHNPVQEVDGRQEKLNDKNAPSETQFEFVVKLSEGAREHGVCIAAGEGLVAEGTEFKPEENGQTKVHQPPEAVDEVGERTRKPIHFEEEELKCEHLEEEMKTMESEEFDYVSEFAETEKPFKCVNLDTSDELDGRFCEDAKKQEELMQNNIKKALNLITTNIEKEMSVALPINTRKYLDECVRNVAESAQEVLKLRVHELETELLVQACSVHDLRTEIVRLHDQLSKRFLERKFIRRAAS
jgi:hypothetical protein